ncbi:hypothetical protein I3842_01G231600 [Carya illinoinensis]|uniref:Oxidative stress 3 n=1 Tax=Carya illinoinensis TaxID=32201 RepID=A0A922G7A0_CARIL|nr:hypothetical protein I3842_01G231600 [Carya illinoinensis]
MDEGRKQLLKGPNTPPYNHEQAKGKDYQWVIMEGHDNDDDDNNININNNYGGSSASNSLEDSSASLGSISSSDMVDDASSTSNSCSSSSHSSVSGPLYELSELIAQLPIKRGLSKYFEGKSQSFTSLSSVMRIEDLAKKETPCRRKMKACKSYGGGLDNHKQYTLPKATISKKASRGSLSSSSFPSRRSGSFLGISRPPLIPAQKMNF